MTTKKAEKIENATGHKSQKSEKIKYVTRKQPRGVREIHLKILEDPQGKK
jgi:hypothetical protein